MPVTVLPGTSARSRQRLRPTPLVGLLATLALMAAPTLWTLATQVWSQDEQGHGPVIIAVALWLIWQRRGRFAGSAGGARRGAGVALAGLGWVLYVVGRSQTVLQAEALGLWLVACGLVIGLSGLAALRVIALPLFAMLFAIPMPGIVVQEVTLPLKIGVSQVAEALTHAAGYPVARSGVILAIDQYRLLVADACAGLASMFTLEAMGLLYMQMRGEAGRARDAALALLLVPIAFAANVVRVVVLVLVTYHWGDAAARGFLHGFAGLLLFAVAMGLMLGADALLARCVGDRRAR